MECTTAKGQIQNAYNELHTLRSKEKEEISQIEKTNRFLDNILFVQERLDSMSNCLAKLTEIYSNLTWLKNMDDEGLEMLRGLISESREVHNRLIKMYVKLCKYEYNRHASIHVKKYKLALDLLRETINDVEDLYFNIPADDEHKRLINELS